MKKTIGILAHVDAGKTTFSEQILYHTHAIRAAGRVDHGDAFLDSHPLEKQRGITIFSDQAHFEYEGCEYNWIDTPGHVDFSAEMERAISIMDYAILIVSAAEGVQSHTQTVWRLLEQYGVPVFLFVNKIDRTGADFDRVFRDMKKRLSSDLVSVASLTDESLKEAAAERDEELLEALLSGEYDEVRWTKALQEQIRDRKLFCVFRGSALKNQGVAEFLACLHQLTHVPADTCSPFRALVYKLRHEAQGERICFFKALSGSAVPRDELSLPDGSRVKLGELRRYHGAKYRPLPRVEAGDCCAVLGLPALRPGDIIGHDPVPHKPLHTEPMMSVSVIRPRELSVQKLLSALKAMEEEEPTLHVLHSPATDSIDLQVMGPIQLEVIRQLMQDRFGISIDFGPMRVLYMETIEEPVIGIGHYEPLRHYAEVHLRLIPGPRGSGVRFVSRCHVDTLALNWQRLIETHIFEKTHKGVLTGAPLTDVCIELLTGRAHLKHTEGGDFRESTYRAIRHGLMQARSILMEPVCRFELRAPADLLGRVMGDMTRLYARTDPPEMDGNTFTLTGEAAFADFSTYHADFLSTTHGRGILSYRFDHYAPCRNASAVIDACGYQPTADPDAPPHSVFCAHGGGFTVPWDQVKNYAHLESE